MADYATRAPPKRFFVSNPDNEEETSQARLAANAASRRVQPLPYQHRPSPSQPSLIQIDLVNQTNTNGHLNPPHSPDTTPSPAADDQSSPPNSTLLQHHSQDPRPQTTRQDSPSKIYDHDRSLNDQPTSPPSLLARRGMPISSRFGPALKAPAGSRPLNRSLPPSADRPQHTRTVTPPDITSPSSLPSSTSTPPEKLIFVTSDSERYVTVDISSAHSGPQVRELILTKLNIFSEDEGHPVSIYKTEIGPTIFGDALSNDSLWALCRQHGDSKGSLKFFVLMKVPPIHDISFPPQPQLADSYPAPPVMSNIPPLRPNRRRSRSRNGSFSSQSDIMPPMDGGYEPDLDIPRAPVKAQPTTPNVVSPPNSATGHREQPPSRRRPNPQGPPPRPGSPLVPDQTSGSPAERSWISQRKESHGNAHNMLPAPPQSPTSLSFQDDLLSRYPSHNRTGSDVAAEPEQTTKVPPEPPTETIKPSRPREIPPISKLRPGTSRENIRGPHTKKSYTAEEDPDWEPVPNQPGWQVDDIERSTSSSTTSATSRGTRPTTTKQRPASPYHSRPYGSARGAQAPLPIMDSRTSSQPRNGGQQLHPGYLATWKAPESGNRPYTSKLPTTMSGLSHTTNLKRNNTKSMDNMKLSPTATSRRPQLPSRPGGNISYAPTNLSISGGTPKSYELPRGSFNRPLQPNATPSDFSNLSTGSRGYPSTSLMSPGLDPYQRPSSALGDTATSPVHPTSRIQSPTYLDSGEPVRSPRAPSPHRPFHAVGPRPRPTNYSAGSQGDRYSDKSSGPETSNTTPPRTPVSPQDHSSDHPNGLVIESSSPSPVENPTITHDRSSETTLRPDEQNEMAKKLGLSEEFMPRLRNGSAVGTHTIDVGQTVVVPPELDDPRPYNDDDYDEDSDNGGGTWIVRPAPKSPRPPLTVQIDSGTPSSSDTATITRSNRPPEVPPKDTHLQPARTRRPDSSFVDANNDSWAPRPPPENIYDHLEKFFPKHDLDKPVIEASSGDTSPTNLEPLAALPTLTPTPHASAIALATSATATATAMPGATIMQPLPSIQEDNDKEKARFSRGKKSIRIVAQEHKKKIDRNSRASDTTYANMMRKRSTKLWGSKLEEVTTSQARNAASSPDSPSGGPTTFKWVRGELIGKGTYGRVYLALNATTGEMIAVKQVELPQTASDKADSRQHMVVQALKSESETLRDLDHPNIVQYLGFEETPTNLSIFLEYVPGGSVGSCLLKHGKFEDNVTRSFTGQILSGLEYLHSKGILHRDLKADNILVEMSGVCKISDFGISKRTEDMHGGAFTAMQGTVFWMAPEVINTQKSGYNNKVDIWSVGCVVLEMWAGMRPWNGEEMLAVMFKLYQSKQPPPVPEDVILSEDADNFRKLCFQINPDDRPTAPELRKHPYLNLPPDWVFNGFT